jgi:hypothetical protein
LGLSMWNNQKARKSDKKSDSILEIEKRFRSIGVGESEICYKITYPI